MLEQISEEVAHEGYEQTIIAAIRSDLFKLYKHCSNVSVLGRVDRCRYNSKHDVVHYDPDVQM